MNCKIRPWVMEDASDLAVALNNKKIHDNLRDGLPLPYTFNDAEGYIRAMLEANKNETYAFAITVDDKVIGSIGVFRKENIHSRTAETGYYISEDYWGKGFGSSAVKQVCDYIFNNTDIVRIFGEPFAYNTASCRVLEKAGFVCEGVLRKNAVKNGKILDMKMYSLINDSTL
jgi:RimJ/RimL family protein N-acetyltransferase